MIGSEWQSGRLRMGLAGAPETAAGPTGQAPEAAEEEEDERGAR